MFEEGLETPILQPCPLLGSLILLSITHILRLTTTTRFLSFEEEQVVRRVLS